MRLFNVHNMFKFPQSFILKLDNTLVLMPITTTQFP